MRYRNVRWVPLLLPLLLLTAAAPQGDDKPLGPEGKWEGVANCKPCHEKTVLAFLGNSHVRLKDFERNGLAPGCAMCHEGADRHAGSGNPADIVMPSKLAPEKVAQICGKCHRSDDFAQWPFGAHARHGVSCARCHKIHQGFGRPAKDQLNTCGECHPDVKAKMFSPSHHPIREGHMQCTECHTPHADRTGKGLKTDERKNDLCLNCHTRYQGPFVFEHAPVEEDCGICHDPHGAAADNLLKQSEPFLCIQCHSAHFQTARIGDTGTVNIPAGQSTNPYGATGWARAYGTRCTQCHAMVHGSDLPSQSLPGRGKSFTR